MDEPECEATRSELNSRIPPFVRHAPDRLATAQRSRANPDVLSRLALGFLVSLLLPALVAAGAAASPAAEPPSRASAVHYTEDREPCADRDPLRRPFFGDLHVHTALSLDASTQGTRNRPADAYRFARGEPLGIQPYAADGSALRSVRLARPLDFAAVTDHAELLGERNICDSADLPGHDSWVCRAYRRWPRAAFFWMNFQSARARRHGFCGPGGELCLETARAPWREIQRAAEEAYDRSSSCEFSTFVGYEWTGAVGAGNNFHRNVVFRNENVPELPISFIDTPKLADLWTRLSQECRPGPEPEADSCDAIAIPHNSNLSNGLMFQTLREDGTPITSEDAAARARYEVLVEVMQHKGDSECALGLGSEDELCGFEKLAMSNFSGRYLPILAEPPVARQFIREVLKRGLALEEKLGVNPFKLGMVASTDTHLGTPGLVAEDERYPGHGGAGSPTGGEVPKGLPDTIDLNPGGLAAVWAEENSRDSLFEAMARREAYGTSGPRMVVRFFGGWDYPEDLCQRSDLPGTGYALGVPMGGDLPPPSAAARLSTREPRFVVSALRDPGGEDQPGTPLQRVQIVKGWTDGDELRERVYEVAGDPGNGAGVKLDTCEPYGSGFDSLCAVWSDPDFDPAHSAFYYARVIENPVCRWSQRMCVAAGVRCDDPTSVGEGFEDCCSQPHRPIVQERAWTSPIWVQPRHRSAGR
jgi:hypothetical protein